MAVGKIPGSSPIQGPISRDVPSEGLTRAQDRQAQVEKRDPRLDQVAKLYEKQFLREMVKAMRGTVSFSDATKPSMGESIYREQLDNEYVEVWGEQGGIGLSDMIYEELAAKFLPKKMELPKKGPVPLSNRDLTRVAKMPTEQDNQVPLRVEIKAEKDAPAAKVQAPWEGTVLLKTSLGENSTVVLQHESGLKSTFVFKGTASPLEPGQKIAKGGTVGVLSPEMNSFFWNIKGL